MKVQHLCSPRETKSFDSAELRENYLLDELFTSGEAKMVYTHLDRTIVGTVVPTTDTITLETAKPIGQETFLAQREVGIMNIGGKGRITADGVTYDLNAKDLLYISMGTEQVTLESEKASNPAKFYLISTPAHKAIETRLVRHEDARRVEIGSTDNASKRTLFQYVNPDVAQSCQLSMGMTVIGKGGAWNTWPCHTHDRRTEVYCYWNMEEDTRVFHLMGEPEETRHIMVANEQAVLSPAWSIHSGVGTGSYAFIWSMAGDNKDYNDMDHCDISKMR
ncbi:5-dehydro-4-deoxy-D-glucuronate isomerase [Polycladidibacter stylochi]|uniref:5-dehydro-4-deoxy-D-glucuronate isomerase n=1 Tax=Polycladidibacter stylochi TaxID=1807766 RepID=UPI000835D721|nr:5-dehydro-4-deoxy-D-glucuronate isomerase [Pseudovibrio stylochi]